jgi:hypothetical protein
LTAIFDKEMYKIMINFLIILWYGLLSCTHSSVPQLEVSEVVKDSLYFLEPKNIGLITEKMMDEVSGIAASQKYPDHLWCHNDSGDKARLFLINLKGDLVHTLYLDNVVNRDWEDIALFNDSATGKSMIYIADIGDNSAKYDYGLIYVLEEPTLNLLEKESKVTISKKLTFTYPEGPRDAETLMVDPANGDIHIISKRENNVGLYKIPYPYPTEKVAVEKTTDLPYTYIVAGDIASDRSAIVIKDYNNIYHFKLKKDQKIGDALLEKPYLPPYTKEPQGESIAWSTDAKSFFTLSEESFAKIQPVLYKYEKGK